MRWGGVLLVVAGTWLLCQVFGGDALGRLGITGTGTPANGQGKINPANPPHPPAPVLGTNGQPWAIIPPSPGLGG